MNKFRGKCRFKSCRGYVCCVVFSASVFNDACFGEGNADHVSAQMSRVWKPVRAAVEVGGGREPTQTADGARAPGSGDA